MKTKNRIVYTLFALMLLIPTVYLHIVNLNRVAKVGMGFEELSQSLRQRGTYLCIYENDGNIFKGCYRGIDGKSVYIEISSSTKEITSVKARRNRINEITLKNAVGMKWNDFAATYGPPAESVGSGFRRYLLISDIGAQYIVNVDGDDIIDKIVIFVPRIKN